MNIFRKLRLYQIYKKSIKSNRVDLVAKFNVRIDRVNRLYTVINVPEEFFSEPYNTRTSDINMISEKFVKEYIGNLSQFLNSIGISEMYDFYEPINKVDKYSYLIVLGFKYMDSVEYNNFVWFRLVPITTLLSFFVFVFYLIFG